MKANDALITEIMKSLNDLNNCFSKIANNYHIQSNLNSDDSYNIHIDEDNDELEKRFRYYAEKIHHTLLVYFEKMNIPLFVKRFEDEFSLFFKNNLLNKNTYDQEYGELDNDYITRLDLFINCFPELKKENINLKDILKENGLSYLENMLNATSVILNGTKITNESTINKKMRSLCHSIFPDAKFPTETFIKTAKEYKPDVLIPSLNCAIEYKYANEEKKLINIIDEILIDVKGYSNHPTYQIFYAVFYVKSGIWSPKRFYKVWNEKKFPGNWKAIYIQS